MLTTLSIRNVVLIERLDLPLGPGLTVLTGETGAGKSIMLDSLGLALGTANGTVKRVQPDHPSRDSWEVITLKPGDEVIGAVELQDVTRLLAQHKAGEARFTEERFVSGFDAPLRSSGTLSFAAPARFARHTLQPTRESMEVQGRTLLLKRGGRTRQRGDPRRCHHPRHQRPHRRTRLRGHARAYVAKLGHS